MPKAGTLLDRVGCNLRRRVGTASARYKLALSSGFVIAGIGMATVVIGQNGHAEDVFSAFGSLFSAPQTAPPQAYETGSVTREARRAARRVSYVEAPRAHGRRHRVAGQPEAGARHRRILASVGDGGEGGAPMRLGRASICVRTCDGFAFPVGTFHGESDIAAHEATCRSECPGAQTALYVLPNGSSSIEEAVEARTGRAYSQKAPGFHYTTYLDESCSCHPSGGNRIASLLRDYTLRRGDAVVTASGIKVFHGGAHFPFQQADFVRLAKSRDIKRSAVATFRDIERASLTADHPTLAQASKPVFPTASLKPLEHQAALEQTAP